MTDLPVGWEWSTIGAVMADGLFVDGDWVESKDQDPNGKVRLIQLADVGVGTFRDRSDRRLTVEAAARLHCTELSQGDVLVARMPEPLGRACLVPILPTPAVTVVDVCVLRPGSEGVEPAWLMWALNAPQIRSQVTALQSGSTRKRISRNNLSTVRLALPPKAEQRRIVEAIEGHLSRLNAAEAALLEGDRRALVLSRLLVDRALQGEWPSARLGDVAEVRLGRQRSPKNATGDRMRPYLRAANVGWGGLRLDDVKDMQFSVAESSVYELRPGDLLLSEASGSPGEVGKPAQFRDEIRECCFQNTLIRVRLPDDMDPDFYELYFRHQARRGRFAEGSRGVGIHHLGAKTLADWQVPVPPIDQQRRIASEISVGIEAVQRTQAAIAHARVRSAALRRSILAGALSGRLVAQDSMDEPASALLDRIRSQSAGPAEKRRQKVKAS